MIVCLALVLFGIALAGVLFFTSDWKVAADPAGFVAAMKAPDIKTQPKDASAAKGEIVVFKVSVSGRGLSYQWQYSKNGGTTWVDWNEKTSAGLRVKVGSSNDGYLYRVVVRNAAGTVTSDTAKLTLERAE